MGVFLESTVRNQQFVGLFSDFFGIKQILNEDSEFNSIRNQPMIHISDDHYITDE